jgi:argininosuccinate lyase
MIRKGRFNKPAAEIAQRYGESVSLDWRPYRYDIAGSLAELEEFSPLLDRDVAKIFNVSNALAKRRAIGAPSPKNIAAQIKQWRSDLELTDEST